MEIEDLKYTFFADTDEPIMLINDYIGEFKEMYLNEDGEEEKEDIKGICGATFQKELLYLDSLGKKRIQIWINSNGGVIMDGYNICSSILKSKTPVDTYCVGAAVSIAGVIFMCGRNRIMLDYSLLMIHPPQGSNDFEMMSKLRDSLITILQAKSNISVEEAGYLMDKTSWLNAQECLDKGFATAIEKTNDNNKKRAVSNTPIANTYKEFIVMVNAMLDKKKKEVLNINKKVNNMINVTNALGLNKDANEESILTAINSIRKEVTAKETEISKLKNELEVKGAELNSKEEDLTAKAAELEVKDAELVTKDAELEQLKEEKQAIQDEKAVDLVNSYVKLGRISNSENSINKWVLIAKADYETAEEMLKDLPVNAVSPKLETAGENNKTNYMQERLAKVLNKK